MAPTSSKKRPKAESAKSSPLQLRDTGKADPEVHIFGDGIVCDTDTRGHATPGGKV